MRWSLHKDSIRVVAILLGFFMRDILFHKDYLHGEIMCIHIYIYLKTLQVGREFAHFITIFCGAEAMCIHMCIYMCTYKDSLCGVAIIKGFSMWVH